MEILKFYMGSLGTLAAAYGLGLLLFLPFCTVEKLPDAVSFFLKMLLGMVGLLVLTALYHTQGLTVLSGIAGAYLLTWWLGGHGVTGARARFAIEWKFLLTTPFWLLVFLAIQLSRNDYFNAGITNCADVDSGVYVTAAEYLIKAGVETSSPWYQLYDLSADGLPKPYHYEDLWLLAFMLKITPVLPLDVFNFVLIPVLAVTVFYCHLALLVSLIGASVKKHFWVVLVAFGAVFIQAIIPMVEWSFPYDMNAITYQKTAFLPTLITAGWLSYKHKLAMADGFFFATCALASILYLPLLFFSLLLLWGFQYYLLDDKVYLKKIGLLAAAVSFYFLFYGLFGSFQTSCLKTVPPGEEGYLYWVVKVLVAQHVKHWLFFASIYLGFIALLDTALFKDFFKKPITGLCGKLRQVLQSEWSFPILLLLLFEASTFASALMNNYVEYFQISENVHTTLSGLLILWLLAILFFRKNDNPTVLRKVAVAFLFIQLLWGFVSTVFVYQQRDSVYATAFVKEARQALQGLDPIGVSINELETLTTYNADPRMCVFCNFLKKSGNGLWANQISIPDRIEDLRYPERKNAVELSPFFRFMQQQKSAGTFRGVEQAQVDFIERYGVDFVVVEKGAPLPALMMARTDRIITDNLSGTRLLILK